MVASPVKSSHLNFSLQFLILGLAFILRIWGINFGLPDLFHADEPIVVNHALRYGTGDFNPHFFNIPPLTSYLLFGIFGFLFIVGKILGLWINAAQYAEQFFRDPTIFYLTGRLALGVLPAVAAIALFMHWLRKCFDLEAWVYWAGLFFAVCFLHVSEAHYIYTDMLLILCIIFFFYALHSLDLAKPANHIKLGLLIGLAAAIKYNGVFLILPYLWFAWRIQKLSLNIIWAGFSAMFAFCVFNPYAIVDANFFVQELHEQGLANQGVPFLHHLRYSLAEGMSGPLLTMSIIGIVRAFFQRDSKRGSVAFFCCIYYLVLWQKGQPFGRYVLPLIPFLIFFAIDVIKLFFSTKSAVIRAILVMLLLQTGGWNLVKDIRFNWIMQQPDIRRVAAEWIEKNIPTGSRIALDGTSLTPRLLFSCEQLEEKRNAKDLDRANLQRIQTYQKICAEKGYQIFFGVNQLGDNPFLFASPEILKSLDAFDEKNIDYVAVVPEFSDKLWLAAIRRKGKLVKVWEPRVYQSSELEVFDPQVITGGPFTWKDLFARKVNGYKIELYRLH